MVVATQVVTDTFPGDGAGTTDLPAPWVQTPTGVWKVDGPTAVAYANGAAGNAVQETGSKDHRVLVNLKTPGSIPGVSGVMFRYANEQNFASFEYVWTSTENAWSLYIEANNVGREIKVTEPVPFAADQPHKIQVDSFAGVITVTIDDVPWGSPVTLTTAEQTALGTKAGLVSFSGRGNFFDATLFTLAADDDPEDPGDPDPDPSLLLSVADFEAITGLDLDPTRAGLLLAQATASIRAFCGWHIAPVLTGAVVVVDGTGGRTLGLPTLRLVDLVAVSEEGVELDLNSTTITWSEHGVIERGCRWTRKRRGVSAVIDHGYDATPGDVVGILVGMVTRVASNPLGVVREQTGPFSMSYAQAAPNQAAGLALTAWEKELLAAYRIPEV